MNNIIRIRVSAPEDTLLVQVIGQAGSGKTTIALVLMGHLQRAGFPVVVKDVDLDDTQQNAASPEKQARRIAGLQAMEREILIDIDHHAVASYAVFMGEGLREAGFPIKGAPTNVKPAPMEVRIDTIQANRDGRAPRVNRTV